MILTYHEIVPTPSRYVYSATITQLEEHLARIRNLPAGIPDPQITFDDGHASHHRYALPLLERFGTKGIFFITAGWTGTKTAYMDWSQLKDLLHLGHQVQAHGWSHVFLTECTPQQLADELRRSRFTLEDRLGTQVDAISVPGGRYNAAVLQACCREGYRRVFVSDPYLKTATHNGIAVMGRAMIRSRYGVEELLTLLRSERSRFSPERARFRMKQSIRAVVGDRFYHDVLWKWLGSPSDKSAINGDYGPNRDENLSTGQ